MLIVNLIIAFAFTICAFTVVYSFIYSVAGHFYKKKEFDNKDQYKKIAVFNCEIVKVKYSDHFPVVSELGLNY